MRMAGRFLLIMIMTQFMTGCWNRIEANDIAIVLGIAIDKENDDNILLSLQIAVPSTLNPVSSGGDKKSTIVVSGKGETVMDAYRRIQEKLPRKVFFAHSRIILIGEKLAKDGVAPVLDIFSKFRESRLRSYVLFTEGRASDILKLTPHFEKISSEEIREQEKQGVSVEVTLREFLSMLLEEGIEPVGARISIKSLENKSKNGSQTDSSVATINGAAVFKNDRLIGWLNDYEVRGLLWTRNRLKSGVITVLASDQEKQGKLSARIVKIHTDIIPGFVNNDINIKVVIHGDLVIEENTSKLDLSDPQLIQLLSKRFATDIEKRVQLVLNKVQTEFKSDIFGFGQEIQRKYPMLWEDRYKKQWDEKFPSVDVQVQATTNIRNNGFNDKSFTIPQ